MAVSRDILFNVRANTAQFNRDLKRGSSRLQRLRGDMNRGAVQAGKYSAALTALAVAGLGKVISAHAKAIDRTAKLAEQAGTTTEELQGLRHAAELTGAGAEKADAGMQVLQKRLGEVAIKGTGAAKDALEALNLNVHELIKLRPGEQFRIISEAMGELGTQAERNAVAANLFSRANQDLVNTLALGRKGLDAMKQEAIGLGIAFSAVDAAKVEQMNDAMTRARQAVSGVGNTITTALSPFIEAAANKFTDAAKSSEGFRDTVTSAMESAAKAVGFVADVIRGLQAVWKVVELSANAAAASILHTVREIVNGVTKLLSVIPGMEVKPPEGLNRMADVLLDRTATVKKELEQLLAEPMPSEGIRRTFEEIRAEAERQAQVIAARRREMAAGGAANDPVAQPGPGSRSTGSLTGGEGPQGPMTLAERAERQAKIREQEANHQQQMIMIQRSAMGTLYNQQVGFLKQLQIAQKASGAKQVGIMSNAFASITAAGAQHSKELFEINKAAGIANAVVSTYTGAAKALELGWPLGPIAAAAIVASGFAKVKAIKSQSFKGKGGAAPSGSAGGGVPSIQPASGIGGQGGGGSQQAGSSGPNITVQIVGSDSSTVRMKEVRELLEQIQEATDDDAGSPNRVQVV